MSRSRKSLDHYERRKIHKQLSFPNPYLDRGCPQHKLACSTERIAKAKAACAFKLDGKKLYPYKCPYCHLWHLTSQEPNE